MTMIVLAAEVRAYLHLETDNPTGSSQYTNDTIGSNVLAAQETLEQACNRWFADRPTTTYTATTMFAPILSIPGFRSFTSITWNGTALVTSGADQNVYPLPDAQQTGLYTALQFRALLPTSGRFLPPDWFDRNYRGILGDTSLPLDLEVAGAGGYAAGTEPYALRHAVKVLASFYTKRPDSILADVAITPAGGVLNYSQMPAEVADFIKAYRGGPQMVSV